MIRKEGKARWTYSCKVCRIRAVYPDQFRAIERQQRHERSTAHQTELFTKALAAAVEPMTEALKSIGLAWGTAASSVAELGAAFAQTQDDFGRAR